MGIPWYQGIGKRSGADLLVVRARAAWGGYRDRRSFADVHAYAGFLGYARSGHTVLGALLDAHPDAVIANELDAFAVLRAGIGRRGLYHMIVRNARAFGEGGAEWTGYSYRVPGAWQGRSRTIRVIGDKKGGLSSRRLHNYPWLLERVRDVTGVPLRLVHVTRDPLDHVASRLRHKPDWSPDQVLDQLEFVYEAVASVKPRTDPSEVLDLTHEGLVADPRRELERCRAFLGLDPEPEWLDAAAGVVLDRPHGGRERIEWTPELRARIAGLIARFPFLAPYAD